MKGLDCVLPAVVARSRSSKPRAGWTSWWQARSFPFPSRPVLAWQGTTEDRRPVSSPPVRAQLGETQPTKVAPTTPAAAGRMRSSAGFLQASAGCPLERRERSRWMQDECKDGCCYGALVHTRQVKAGPGHTTERWRVKDWESGRVSRSWTAKSRQRHRLVCTVYVHRLCFISGGHIVLPVPDGHDDSTLVYAVSGCNNR